jgi:hypothetical protein
VGGKKTYFDAPSLLPPTLATYNPKPKVNAISDNARDLAFASIMNQVIDHRSEMFYWLERIIDSQSLPECKAIAKMLLKRQ